MGQVRSYAIVKICRRPDRSAKLYVVPSAYLIWPSDQQVKLEKAPEYSALGCNRALRYVAYFENCHPLGTQIRQMSLRGSAARISPPTDQSSQLSARAVEDDCRPCGEHGGEPGVTSHSLGFVTKGTSSGNWLAWARRRAKPLKSGMACIRLP